MLKARYFKETDFFNALIGSNPSYIRRSIIWETQVILKGYRWKIGNGENISVFRGNWITRPSTFKPISTPNLPSDATVAVLIDNENKWKADLIQKMFSKEDTEAILSIPLPRRKEKDQMIWHYDKKGEYSIKTGYQVALNKKFPDPLGCLSSNNNNWSIIWKLTLPEKIKIFIWKATKNLLPTIENLVSVELFRRLTASVVEIKWKTFCMCWWLARQQKRFCNSLLWQMQFMKWVIQTS